MRRFCLGIFALVCFSCTKREYVDNYDKTAPPFFINGLKNFRADKNPFERTGPFYQWPLYVDYKSDTPRQIQLSIVHQNPKLRCLIEGENDAYPDYVSQVVLYDSGAVNGLYNFTLLAARAGDSVQEFPFQITLAGSENCGEFLSELRFIGDVYGPGSESFLNIRTTVPTPNSDTLIFHHLRKDINLVTIPNCYDRMVYIPKQKIGDTTYSGIGIIKYNEYLDGVVQLELDVLEEFGNWGSTSYYRIFSR